MNPSFVSYTTTFRCGFFLLTVLLLLISRSAFADCKEFKIVEYEDRVEAVCVGEPLTEAQKKANQEEQSRLDRETQRQRIEEQNRQREAIRAEKAKIDAEEVATRKKRDIKPLNPQQPANRSTNILMK
jgi:hypothetical protein